MAECDGGRLWAWRWPCSPAARRGDCPSPHLPLAAQSYVVDWTSGDTLWEHIDGLALVRIQPHGAGMIVVTPEIVSRPHELWLLPTAGPRLRLS